MRLCNVGYMTKRVLCVVLSFVLMAGMTGCKPTDFFTEVIITPDSEKIDTNNENIIRVNNPDAKQKTDALSSLTWTDESKRSEDTENLVVWSDQPNSTMMTHHSRFDLSPRFPGIRASDGMRVLYDKKASFEYSVDTDDANDRDDVSASSSGKTGEQADAPTTDGNQSDQTTTGQDAQDPNVDNGSESSEGQGNSAAADKKGDSGGGKDSGGDTAGTDQGTDVSPDPSEEEGRTPDYSGYNGDVKHFDPTELLAEIPLANSVTVVGKQAAVMVQSLGGKGSICAMGSFDFNGTEESNKNNVCYEKTFATVFGSNPDEWDNSAYVWSSSSSDDLASIDAAEFVAKCDYDGVVIYDQTVVGDIQSKLSEDVKRETYGYNIRFMPVDLSSIDGIKNASYMVGQVLSESTSLASGWSSVDMASDYWDTVESLMSDLADVRKNNAAVYSSFATDAAQGMLVTRSGSSTRLENQIVLFADYGQDKYKPLNDLISSVGLNVLRVHNSTEIDRFYGALSLMSPVGSGWSVDQSGIAAGKWYAASNPVNQMSPTTGTAGSASGNLGGLGSKTVPYLVVCGSSDGSMTSKDVASKVEDSIRYYNKNRKLSFYSAFPYGSSDHLSPSANGVISNIGATVGDDGDAVSENPLLDSNRVAKTVRANPTGCLGSWSGVSFECVLEAAWLAAVYSESPDDGSQYKPRSDWSGVSVYVGDGEVKGSGKTGMDVAHEITSAFYEKFYRYGYTPDFDE